MGAVYRAVRRSDKQTVAVKVMLAKIAVDDNARWQFLREIDITRQLDHAHVVRLLESGSAGAAFYSVLEYCDGGCLGSFAKKAGGRLPLDVAAPLMLQCLDGLAFAHGVGIVHRDLKPQNVLLQQVAGRWVAKISDFGLAKSFERAGLSGLTATGRVGGTYHYMPREQLTDYKFVRPVSDLWSMGATFYKLLSGQYPRDVAPDRDPMEVVLRDSAVPLARREPSLPEAVCAVIDRSLAVEPSRRYASAAEMKQALQDALRRSGR
jgi:serine/threonine protein kinase